MRFLRRSDPGLKELKAEEADPTPEAAESGGVGLLLALAPEPPELSGEPSDVLHDIAVHSGDEADVSMELALPAGDRIGGVGPVVEYDDGYSDGSAGEADSRGIVKVGSDDEKPLGFRERARRKKMALILRKDALKQQAMAMKTGDLGSVGGRFASEAALDSCVVTVQAWLLVINAICMLFACLVPWCSASTSYIAPYDGARAQLDVQLSLWSGTFQLQEQSTDMPPEQHTPEPEPEPEPEPQQGSQLDVLTNTSAGTGVNTSVPGPARPAWWSRTFAIGATNPSTHWPYQPLPKLNRGSVAPGTAPPPPPKPTASGPMREVVDATVSWGGVVDMQKGMHPGVQRIYGLSGGYQLPPAGSDL